jgi:hypothetical protein
VFYLEITKFGVTGCCTYTSSDHIHAICSIYTTSVCCMEDYYGTSPECWVLHGVYGQV